jgi:hypothetical protein
MLTYHRHKLIDSINLLNCDSHINIPSSQTYRSYLCPLFVHHTFTSLHSFLVLSTSSIESQIRQLCVLTITNMKNVHSLGNIAVLSTVQHIRSLAVMIHRGLNFLYAKVLQFCIIIINGYTALCCALAQDSLDRGSARCKASTYTLESINTNTHVNPRAQSLRPWDHSHRLQCCTSILLSLNIRGYYKRLR